MPGEPELPFAAEPAPEPQPPAPEPVPGAGDFVALLDGRGVVLPVPDDRDEPSPLHEIELREVRRRERLREPGEVSQAIGDPVLGPPTPAAPASTPRSQTTTPPAPATQGIFAPETYSPAFPSLGLQRLLDRRSRFARSTSSRTSSSRTTPGTSSPPAPAVPATPIAPAVPIPGLTPVETTGVGSRLPPAGRTTVRQCECKTPRRPQRKCLARAPVIWAGGPKKGKPAGTRCIRREKWA